jgi:MerR family transcriptional regulator/heat shock protein HspR
MDWPDTDHGVFAISVAAQLCGLHPQTLRVYEREGLVDPDRSTGGTRLYSGREVEKLRQMAALTDIGINIAGIKRVLELQEEVRRLKAEVQRMDAKGRRKRPSGRSLRDLQASAAARSRATPLDLADLPN